MGHLRGSEIGLLEGTLTLASGTPPLTAWSALVSWAVKGKILFVCFIHISVFHFLTCKMGLVKLAIHGWTWPKIGIQWIRDHYFCLFPLPTSPHTLVSKSCKVLNLLIPKLRERLQRKGECEMKDQLLSWAWLYLRVPAKFAETMEMNTLYLV